MLLYCILSLKIEGSNDLCRKNIKMNILSESQPNHEEEYFRARKITIWISKRILVDYWFSFLSSRSFHLFDSRKDRQTHRPNGFYEFKK